jgi:hypothetical protein
MEAAIAEGERVGKDLSEFWFGSFCSCLPLAADNPVTKNDRRPTPTGTIEELFELTQKIGEEVLPEAKKIKTRSLV